MCRHFCHFDLCACDVARVACGIVGLLFIFSVSIGILKMSCLYLGECGVNVCFLNLDGSLLFGRRYVNKLDWGVRVAWEELQLFY